MASASAIVDGRFSVPRRGKPSKGSETQPDFFSFLSKRFFGRGSVLDSNQLRTRLSIFVLICPSWPHNQSVLPNYHHEDNLSRDCTMGILTPIRLEIRQAASYTAMHVVFRPIEGPGQAYELETCSMGKGCVCEVAWG
jgi:hypothetical protein